MRKKKETQFQKDYRLAQQNENKRIASLKPAFIKLKTYAEKLKFWENHGDPFCYFYNWSDDFSGMSRALPAHDYIPTETLDGTNVLTIAPRNDEERELYNRWFFSLYQNKFHNLEKSKNDFLDELKKTKYPLELIDKELKKFEPNPNHRRVWNQDQTDKEYEDYKLKGLEPIWKKADIETIKRFAAIHFKVEYIFFLEHLKKEVPTEEGNIYWIKDGKQVLSTWNFMNQTGMVESLKNKHGATINPTHNFELLKKVRLELFESKKQEFVESRNLNEVETTEFEINSFYIAWLNNELKVIQQWLSDKYPNGEFKGKPDTSTQLELSKYKYFVDSEIGRLEYIINSDPFGKLFDEAIAFAAIEAPSNEAHKAAMKSYYNYTYNVWLQENKGWEFGNAMQYMKLASKENFIEFLKYQYELKKQAEQKFEYEKSTWQVEPTSTIEAQKIHKLKIDYIKENLKSFILKLTKLTAYEKPSTYLDELLEDVMKFNDFDFECTFFLNIHYLCKENADLFWSESHKKDISQWLGKAKISTNVFETTWLKDITEPNQQGVGTKLTIPQIALMHVYQNKVITRESAKNIVKQFGHNSGDKLYQFYGKFLTRINRVGVEDSDIRNENKVKLLEIVISNLSENDKQQAIDELNTLKSSITKER